jgi:hypothetical protein
MDRYMMSLYDDYLSDTKVSSIMVFNNKQAAAENITACGSLTQICQK